MSEQKYAHQCICDVDHNVNEARLQRENEELRKKRDDLSHWNKQLRKEGAAILDANDINKDIISTLREELVKTKKHLADANRGAERQQKVNMIHCDTINTLHSQLTAANERAEKAERERDGFKQAYETEIEGNRTLRLTIKARDGENFRTAVKRIAEEKDSAEISLTAAQKEIEGLKETIGLVAYEIDKGMRLEVLKKILLEALTPKPETKG